MGKFLTVAAIAAISLPVFFSGCNTAGCTDLRSATPLAEFYSADDNSAIYLDSLQIAGIGAPGDSILLSAGELANQVYMPLRSTKTSTSWCISYKWKSLDYPQLNDTITFDYDAQPWFASADCGAMFRFTIKKVKYTTHLLDSVAVLDSLISNTDETHLRLYFRTADSDDEQE